MNKVKWIKRNSYGQVGFALLQRRLLLHPTVGKRPRKETKHPLMPLAHKRGAGGIKLASVNTA